MTTFPRIVAAAGAPLPFFTAAQAMAEALDTHCVRHDTPQAGAINLGPPAFAERLPGTAAVLARAPGDAAWDLVLGLENRGWLITGSTPLGAAHAALFLLDKIRESNGNPAPFTRLRIPRFRTLDLEFDDWTGGFNRMADGFDIEQHARDIVRVGGTSLEVNMLADVVPVQVRERAAYDDMYQWWCVYSAALDMFVESSLNRGTYDHRLLERNLAKLKRYRDIALQWGLKPTLQVFEPRVIPERFFAKYPDLRGARVDCSDYSAEAEFALDPCHPMVRKHYRELMRNLLSEAPEIASISVWSQDSNAGFPWARQLYAGPNGPRAARKRPVEESVTALMTALRDGGREVNPDFRTELCLAWFQDHEVEGQILPDEIAAICSTLPRDIGVSFTIGLERPAATAPLSGRVSLDRARKIRSFGREPKFQIEGPSNWWKPLGPMHGVPHPRLTFAMLHSLEKDAEARDVILRGGIQTEVFVPNYINNEVIRAFLHDGAALDLETLLAERAATWTGSPAEAAALLEAWLASDAVVRRIRVLAWTVNFVSGRTLWRRLVRPLVPDQSRLEWEDWRHYRHLEFTVGPTDPAWIDHFYKGWSRMVRDDDAHVEAGRIERELLPRLTGAVDRFESLGPLSPTARDVRDRLRCLYHILRTDRNLLEAQEAIHACLAENREQPETSRHAARLRDRLEDELENTRAFKALIESSPSRLIPETSGEETTYMHKAPFAWQLGNKIAAMERHLGDSPGPWFEELEQAGGWTSDLRDRLEDL